MTNLSNYRNPQSIQPPPSPVMQVSLWCTIGKTLGYIWYNYTLAELPTLDVCHMGILFSLCIPINRFRLTFWVSMQVWNSTMYPNNLFGHLVVS